jgi:hypothetical protein
LYVVFAEDLLRQPAWTIVGGMQAEAGTEHVRWDDRRFRRGVDRIAHMQDVYFVAARCREEKKGQEAGAAGEGS